MHFSRGADDDDDDDNKASAGSIGATPMLSSLLLLLLLLLPISAAFQPPAVAPRRRPTAAVPSPGRGGAGRRPAALVLRSADPASAIATESGAGGDDDDEYEYVEYDLLEESDFQGSEWLMGTNLDKTPDAIDETWVRLGIDKDGKQVAIWGDNAEGNWKFDRASQFLSMSKNSILGKKIWAGVVEDYYYSQGSVRGWSFFSAAAVLGQWQAKRLGVDREDAGTPPWFEPSDEDPAANGETQEE